jgi:hypothetical protein
MHMAASASPSDRGQSIDGFRLPTQAEEITPEFLSRAISVMHPGAGVESFDMLEALGVGGMVSTAGRAQLRLHYTPGSPPLPKHVVSKMIIGQKSIMPASAYETEVQIYRRMIRDLPIPKPLCLGAFYEQDTGNFMLMLEHLGDRGAQFTNVLQPPLTPEQVGTLLDTLAVLHAHYWESPALDRESGWLSMLISGPGFDAFERNDFIVSLMEHNLAESPYRRDVLTRTGMETPQKLWRMLKAVHRHQADTIPLTLCHGDAGEHNTFFLADGSAGFLDWQLSAKATWTHDVHYLIVTSLSVKDRRLHERSLIERYLRRLKELGVRYEPSLDLAMAEYSLAIMWGFTIGWFAVPSNIYGMAIISANIERLFAAAADHDVFRRAERLL